MLTKTQLKIIAYLIDNEGKLLGIRELAKEISSVYYLVQRNVQKLKKEKAVILQKAGRTDLVSLPPQVEPAYLEEAEKFKRRGFYVKYPVARVILKKIIEHSASGFFVLLVFGSYAKKPRKDSDLDLLVIVPNQKQAELMEKNIASIARTAPIRIHETIITEKTFASLRQQKEFNVVQEAKEKHILIYGSEAYWRLSLC